ncbi:MAG: CDP-alcohol phosphatidyltransferase family protein [Oligoflexia bacterium]|nr:CDP-alcohol phosphatidyltransferase family protein [Oligoflexia bacterium]
MSLKEEYWKSIKSFDTEEKLDLYFYRLFGFLIAKIAFFIRMSPTQLTFIGLVLGLSCGYFFYHNESNQNLIIASILLVTAGIFDSSDGQLARMGGKSTKFGLVLDGLCDNLVFASAYIGSMMTMYPIFGYWIWPIGIFAGVCHSFQSSILDYYNREYLYFGYGKTQNDYWNHTLHEARTEKESAIGKDKIFWNLRFSWLWQQNFLSSRTDETRFLWKKLVSEKDSKSKLFQNAYRDRNRFVLRTWRLMGANFHTIMIITFAFLRRFDLYLIVVDIFALTIMLFILKYFQKRQDSKLQNDLKELGLI